ncbi:BCD family MFS transporter [Piscinibacterium candidicorallinum]|uniref:BCD family MFS transporter n=1 Tax=Piscinibacterium candidicorallinum TaxID=1793872 RepID=A0ABV7H668_9BURK
MQDTIQTGAAEAHALQGGAMFSWRSVVRLGLVQACLGAVVVLTTSTLNRVMVVEHALPAMIPGLLVALHYIVQMTRPRMGWGSDVGGRRTPWIIGGMAVLALGGFLAACATVLMASSRTQGFVLAVLAFTLIGLGVSASGTSLLVLLAKRVDEGRKAGAATVVWLMMIAGFALTAATAGKLLDPYSGARLLAVSGGVSVLALLVSCIALWGIEGARPAQQAAAPEASREDFRAALREVWADPTARRFTLFVFTSMLAYSAQDLILEPFAGMVLGFTPGESTALSGVQHGGVLAGMLLVALAAGRGKGRQIGSLKAWCVGGCIASALAMMGLVMTAFVGDAWPFKATVFILGVANGAFSIAAIGSMMSLASAAGPSTTASGANAKRREGTRMGLWGAAQAIAFGLGGFAGTVASDLARWLLGSAAAGYASVFALEAVFFLVAAALAASLGQQFVSRARTHRIPDALVAQLEQR